MTLVIRANADMTAPLADTPSLPNISDGLLARWSCLGIAQANNTDLINWLADGQGTETFRLLTKSEDTSYSLAPKYMSAGGPNGLPSVRFANQNRLRTLTEDLYTGDKTIAMLVKPDAGFLTSSSRPFCAGEAACHWRIEKSSALYWMARAANAAVFAISTIPVTTEWSIAIVNLKATSESSTDADFRVNNETSSGVINSGFGGIKSLALGMTYSNIEQPSTFIGDICEFWVYDRLLTDNDKSALVDLLTQTYGL